MEVGAKVHVKGTADGSDQSYAGRKGIIVEFDPTLPWAAPRALLAPDQFVFVHFLPRTELEKRRGTPIAPIRRENLKEGH